VDRNSRISVGHDEISAVAADPGNSGGGPGGSDGVVENSMVVPWCMMVHLTIKYEGDLRFVSRPCVVGLEFSFLWRQTSFRAKFEFEIL
jgi:hypothetical protein